MNVRPSKARRDESRLYVLFIFRFATRTSAAALALGLVFQASGGGRLPLHVAGIVGAAAGQRDAVIDDISRTPAAAPAGRRAGLLALERVLRGDTAFLFRVPDRARRGARRMIGRRRRPRMVGTRRGRRAVARVSATVSAARVAGHGAEEQQGDQQRTHGAQSVRQWFGGAQDVYPQSNADQRRCKTLPRRRGAAEENKSRFLATLGMTMRLAEVVSEKQVPRRAGENALLGMTPS
jgi:hypothetical protein